MSTWGKPSLKAPTRVLPLYSKDDAKHDEMIAQRSARRRENFLATRDLLSFNPGGHAEPALPKRPQAEPTAAPYGTGAREMAPVSGRSAFAKVHLKDSTDGTLAGPFIIGGGMPSSRQPRQLPSLHAARRDNDIFNRGLVAGATDPEPPKHRGVSHKWTASAWAQGV
jgi:hypothetical protein